MKQLRAKAIHISTKYTVQIEPLHSEWDRFITMLEKEILDILHEMLSHDMTSVLDNHCGYDAELFINVWM